jgi:hypothetical protein
MMKAPGGLIFSVTDYLKQTRTNKLWDNASAILSIPNKTIRSDREHI